MLFVFDSIHVSVHDDREEYHTTTKPLVQTYMNKETNSLCVGNTRERESLCVKVDMPNAYSSLHSLHVAAMHHVSHACCCGNWPLAQHQHSAQGYVLLVSVA